MEYDLVGQRTRATIFAVRSTNHSANSMCTILIINRDFFITSFASATLCKHELIQVHQISHVLDTQRFIGNTLLQGL